MYGLPSDFDVSRFIGRTLEYISFSPNTVHLSFDGEVSITVESSFSHSADRAEGRLDRTTVPPTETRLLQLLGATVESAEASPDATLTIGFANGQVFRCYDDSPAYESYRVAFGVEEIVV